MAKARAITGLDPQASTATNARIIVRARLEDMYAYTACVESPADIQGLHDLRIAAKRVRYTLEIFEKYLPAASTEFAEELAKLQDELGTLHDSEVMLGLLHLLLQEEPATPGTNNIEATRADQKKPLLSADMLDFLLHAERHTALSEKERAGLMVFLHRQEQRRAQAYTSFRSHWEQLEQRHFREEIIQMLDHGRD